jgi:predicted nuclease of predicted toxin-antitoxin system
MDFHQRAVLHGPPPKVVWIRLGNCTTKKIETLLRMRAADVKAFGEDKGAALLALP